MNIMIEVTGPTTVAECKGASMHMTLAIAELYMRGIGPYDGAVPFYYKDSILTARTPDQEIRGFITYRYEEGEGTMWIMLGWVEPKLRKQGIYRKLWDKLVEVAREKKAARIAGSTHLENSEMRGFYRSVGRVETHVNSVYEMPKPSEIERQPEEKHDCSKMECKVTA